MLLFWISAALLTTLAVLALVRPLMRIALDGSVSPPVPRSAADIAVYRDQIAEVEADRARGLISETEAEAARIEIARRLLASADADGGNSQETTSRETTAAVPAGQQSARIAGERLFTVIAFAVPALALALYASLGSPGLPGRPVAERLAKAPDGRADIEELVARVEAQLRKNPADGQGWDVIAPVYLRLQRYHDAAEAFRRALDILGEAPRRLSGLAESTRLANDGIVTEAARKAYARLVELEPGRTEARFGLALAMEQDGDLDAAEAAYRQLVEDALPSMPWRLVVMERLEAIAQRRGPAGAGAAAGPEPGAADAIAALPEGQRREVILHMVEGLATRLKADGRDLEGWQRLLRSWTMLGDIARAEAALADARKALAGDDQALGEINAFARNLGLKS